MAYGYDDPDDYDAFEEELMPGCDYGCSEFCEHPFYRETGQCTFGCPLYLEQVAEMNKGYRPSRKAVEIIALITLIGFGVIAAAVYWLMATGVIKIG